MPLPIFIITKQMYGETYVFCGYKKRLLDEPTAYQQPERIVWKREKSTPKSEIVQYHFLTVARRMAQKVCGIVAELEAQPSPLKPTQRVVNPYADLINFPNYVHIIRHENRHRDSDRVKIAVRRFCIINNISLIKFSEIIGVSKGALGSFLGKEEPSRFVRKKVLDFLIAKDAKGYRFEDLKA